MERALHQLVFWSEDYECPVFVAGDIFDHWNSPVELVNLVAAIIPEDNPWYFVPGQHDLPYHDLNQLHRTGLYSLMLADRMRLVEPTRTTSFSHQHLKVWGVPWGESIPNGYAKEGTTQVLLAHRYLWTDASTGYPGAPKQERISDLPPLGYFHAAFFGDNHGRFRATKDDCRIINCGAAMRRDINQINYQPMASLLVRQEDGVVDVWSLFFDISKDHLRPRKDLEGTPIQENPMMREFLESLGRSMESCSGMFEKGLRHCLTRDDLGPRVKRFIQELLEDE